jgi:hypothetical protein
MVVVAMVNMLLLLVGFRHGLRQKGPAADRGTAGDSAAKASCTEQLTEVVQKG